MPIRRIEHVPLPFAGKRFTPDTSRLARLYLDTGNALSAIDLRKGEISQRGMEQLANLFSGFAQTTRATEAAKVASATRQREREEDKAFTAEEQRRDRQERENREFAQEAIRQKEREEAATTRASERAEAAVSDAIDKAPRGIASPALLQAAKQFPNQAARFVVQDGVAVLPMTGAEKQAYDREKAAEASRKADDNRLQQRFEELKRHNQATEAAAAAAANDKTALTPEGVDIAALNYRKTGVMPPLGMGDKGTRQRIINRAATMTKEDMARVENIADIAASKQDFAANQASLNALQKSRDAIGAFEQTAQKNIDVFLNVAGKVVDSGSPLANRLLRHVSGKVLGSPDVAAYEAARQVAVNEIAKITSNPTLAGQLTDSARKEVASFAPEDATLAQTVAVMRLLKTEMQNRTRALDAELDAVRNRRKTQVDAPASGFIEALDPQGNIHHAPAGTPLPQGWKLKQ